PLVYLDSAATTQKPRSVIQRIVRFYEEENANVHRGLHRLAEAATRAYEEARAAAARFSGAAGPDHVVFTRNATEAVNLVARAWGGMHLGPGDEVIATEMEHHSNLVPWQEVCRSRGAILRIVPVTEDGRLDREAFRRLLGPRTRLLAVSAKSNVLGTVNPVAEMAAEARSAGARVLVDAAQAAPTAAVDLRAWGADFVAFSGHKMCGPMGIGVLALSGDARSDLPPFLFGGEMVRRVTLEGATWNDPPWLWEAGTPSVADAAGLQAAIEYLEEIGAPALHAHEVRLTARCMEMLAGLGGIRIFGPRDPSARPGIVSFWMEDVHPHDLAQLLDADGVAIRAGHHCAQPLMARHGVVATARASFYLYNTDEDVDAFVRAVLRSREMLAPGPKGKHLGI
ncbi:MAG: SufS family cysteine desulfurase, partial [Planctomycetaceae bacterium]|nr:SufS family cysteine desulfurase [Planctomycetaceae bacterium]